jgi:hypothetical protein
MDPVFRRVRSALVWSYRRAALRGSGLGAVPRLPHALLFVQAGQGLPRAFRALAVWGIVPSAFSSHASPSERNQMVLCGEVIPHHVVDLSVPLGFQQPGGSWRCLCMKAHSTEITW